MRLLYGKDIFARFRNGIAEKVNRLLRRGLPITAADDARRGQSGGGQFFANLLGAASLHDEMKRSHT
ncbi:hypothetical protein D3C86_1961080 [compost metagenome]